MTREHEGGQKESKSRQGTILEIIGLVPARCAVYFAINFFQYFNYFPWKKL